MIYKTIVFLIKLILIMSKGSILLGYARGAIGNIVLSRLKGQEVAKARNRHPNNPRTEAQVTQRALFADAVKFFVEGNQNLFPFSFEDKKITESYYNAFMRHNAKRGVMISPNASSYDGYPALGNWVVTKGSLEGFEIICNPDGREEGVFADLGKTTTDAPTTVAEISTYFIANDIAKAGDIITGVKVLHTPANSIPSIEATEANYKTKWTITQFIVNTNDTTKLETLGFRCEVNQGGEYDRHLFLGVGSYSAGEISCATIIRSQETSGGALVSTQEMKGTTDYNNALEECRTDNYKQLVLDAWDAKAKAILQGGE